MVYTSVRHLWRTLFVYCLDHAHAEGPTVSERNHRRRPKLATSGFTLAKRPEPIEEVGISGNVVARNSSKPNTVKISWGKALGGKMSRLEVTDTDPNLPSTVWTTVGITSRQSMEVGDRELYKAYYFRVIALGKTTEGKPSDVVIGRAA